MPVTLRPLLLVLAYLALFAAGEARAACAVAPSSGMTFAPSSSYDVRAGSVAAVGAGAGFSCNGSIITLLGGARAEATVTSSNGFRLRGPGGDLIPYRLSADPGGAHPFTQGSTINYFNPALLSLLGILDAGRFSPSLYAAPLGGANVAAGTYTDTLTVRWSWFVCHGVGVGGVCLLGESGTGAATISVTLSVSADCRISAPDVSFGAAALASQFAPVTQAVAVDCTKGSAYSVGFTGGQAGAARPWRAMTDGRGNTLQYNIYRGDGVTIWDDLAATAGGAVGTGAVDPGRLHAYVARIDPDQPTPPAGRYEDRISVVISF